MGPPKPSEKSGNKKLGDKMDTEVETRSLINEEREDFNIAEMNTQRLRQIIDTSEEEKLTQKVTETQHNMLTQTVDQQARALQEEQTKIIKQLITKNEELTNLTENEALMRVNLYVVVEKMKNKILSFKTFYNILKQTLEKSSEAKNNTDLKYTEFNLQTQNYDSKINSKVNDLVLSNSELIKQLQKEKSEFLKLKTEAEFIQNKQNDEITSLKFETMKLIEKFKGQENFFKKTLEEKEFLLNEKEKIISEANVIIEKINNQIAELEMKNSELKKEIEKIIQEQGEDKNMIETLQKKSTDLKNLLEIEKKASENLKSKNIELQKIVDEISEAKNTIIQMTADYNNLKNKLDSTNDQTKILQKTISEISQKSLDLEQIIQKEAQNFETKISESNETILDLQKELEEKNQEIENIQSKFNNLEKKSATNLETLQRKFDNCFIEKENLKTNVERLKDDKDQMRTDYNKKFEEIKRDYDKKILKMENESNKIIKESAEQIQKYTNDISHLKEQLTKMELKNNELQVAKKNLENELNQKIQETQKLVNEKAETDVQNIQNISSESNQSSEPTKLDIGSKLPYKNTLTPKYGWFDDSSDSSYEPDYPKKKPKLIQRRKVPAASSRPKTTGDELFDSLHDNNSMFKQPKLPPSKTSRRKTVF